jgi:flagellar hook-associated protein 2
MGSVGINFGAATSGTGFDVTTTVASIVANLQAVETPWNSQLTTLKADDTALTSIGTDLGSLSTSLQSLTDFEGVMAEKEGSSSDTSVLTLTSAGATASAGSHTVVVGQLAQTASDYSDSIAANDTISGALTIKVGNGTATTIPVVSGVSDTLATYAAAINLAGIGVTASVISDTSGSRLSLVSDTSGAAGALTVTQGGTTAATTGATTSASDVAPTASVAASNTFTLPTSASELSGTFSYAVGGSDGGSGTVNLGSTPLSLTATAQILDADSGFLSAGLYASVSGAKLVITGVTDSTGAATINTTASTLTTTTPAATYAGLADVTTPTSTLNINTGLTAQNASLTVDGIQVDSASNTVSTAIPGVTFQLLSKSTTPVQVEITNDNSDVETAFQTFVSAYNKVLGDLTTQEGNDSSGNPEPLYGNPIVSQIQSALSLALTAGAASGSVSNLAQLGITVTNTGTLTLDTSTLDSILNSNYSDVVGFLQNSGSFGQTLSASLDNLGSSSPTGAITLALASDSSQETTLNDDVTAQNALIATDQTNLTTELNTANQTLQAIPEQLDEVNELYSAMTGYNENSTD